MMAAFFVLIGQGGYGVQWEQCQPYCIGMVLRVSKDGILEFERSWAKEFWGP